MYKPILKETSKKSARLSLALQQKHIRILQRRLHRCRFRAGHRCFTEMSIKRKALELSRHIIITDLFRHVDLGNVFGLAGKIPMFKDVF